MSTSSRDQIRWQSEEEDDDMMLFLFPALSLLGSSSGVEKKQRHAFDEPGKIKIHRLLQGHEKNRLVHFRMEPRIFKVLISYLRRNKIVHDSRVHVEEKLGFFLYMLSHNSYEDLQITFHHSNDTFHHHINHFFEKVIPTLSRHFLKAPDPNPVHPKIAENPRFFSFFRNCLDAIDGTHIPISISSKKASPIRNRKGTLNINVMVACDFTCMIHGSPILRLSSALFAIFVGLFSSAFCCDPPRAPTLWCILMPTGQAVRIHASPPWAMRYFLVTISSPGPPSVRLLCQDPVLK
jgi:hypothetical protein